MRGWTRVPPIAGGNTDVERCDGPYCGALVRRSQDGGRAAHDRDFHREDKPPAIEGEYGEPHEDLGALALPWQEFMHYLYLPVRIPSRDDGRLGLAVPCDADSPATGPQYALPQRLGFLSGLIREVTNDAAAHAEHLDDPYVYVTARRGFATPGNPLNRPGWHCDDFGGADLNYIWSDVFPTRLLRSDYPLAIPSGERESMEAMSAYERRWNTSGIEGQIEHGRVWIEEMPAGHLLRLTPYVIHDTPIIPEPGGMRSFFKISVSAHRYNLIGNSHNHLLDYQWQMYDRATMRNRPDANNSDYVIER